MKRAAFIAIMIALMFTVSSGFSYAQQGSGSGQGGGWGCPWMGQGRATGPGGWYCPWMGGYGNPHHYGPGGQSTFNQKGEPLTKDQAQQLLKDYLQNNPNLKVGELTDKGDFYDATIVTQKEGALVERLNIDKNTGWFRNVQ